MYIKSFLFCGLICMIGQLILDKTKVTPGHITTMFVVLGSFLDIFNIYDKIIDYVGGGALVPITSFGHLIMHGVMESVRENGFIGLFSGVFNYTATGVSCVIVFSLILSLIFDPKE